MRQHGRKIPSGSHRHRAPEITKRQVSRPRQRLIELMQDRDHGWIENLEVRDREPVIDPNLAAFRDVKFESDNGPREELALDDFVLKAKHIELLQFFDRLHDGVIQRLEFKNGLPFRMVVKEPAV